MIEPVNIPFDLSLQAARPPGDQGAPQAREAACSLLPAWIAMHRVSWNHGYGDPGAHLAPLPLRQREFAVRKAANAVHRLTLPKLFAAKFPRQRLTGFSNP
jgi:hypothetical protein